MRLAIVGNSAAALSALESFRRRDRGSPVTVVTDEGERPYSRVLLPYYLRGRLPFDRLFIRGADYYARHGAELIAGARVERVDVSARRLELANGRRVGFDRLLVATGSRPARPPIPGLAGPSVLNLWTIDDAVRLDPLLRPGSRMLVLGSGFVALQAAWVAKQRGLDVTVVELMERIMPRVLDEPAARLLHEQMVAQGVAVHTATRTRALESGARGVLHVDAGGAGTFEVDAVIVATGAVPNADLLPQAVEAGEPGIPVAASMATSVEGIFAAGDVTRGPAALGGPREIHALWPTAVEQGKVAGANLAGAGVVYGGSLSMNVTEMFGWTVASLGRFLEEEGDEVVVRADLDGIDYAKIVVRQAVPIGAVAMGGPEAALLLGRLRPFARQGKPVDELAALIEGRELAYRVPSWRVARGRGLRAG